MSALDEFIDSNVQIVSVIQENNVIAAPTFSRIEAVGVRLPLSRYTTATTIMARDVLTRKWYCITSNHSTFRFSRGLRYDRLLGLSAHCHGIAKG
jgi:hypothetical protein